MTLGSPATCHSRASRNPCIPAASATIAFTIFPTPCQPHRHVRNLGNAILIYADALFFVPVSAFSGYGPMPLQAFQPNRHLPRVRLSSHDSAEASSAAAAPSIIHNTVRVERLRAPRVKTSSWARPHRRAPAPGEHTNASDHDEARMAGPECSDDGRNVRGRTGRSGASRPEGAAGCDNPRLGNGLPASAPLRRSPSLWSTAPRARIGRRHGAWTGGS